MSGSETIDFLGELLWRGQIHQCTDDGLLKDGAIDRGSAIVEHLGTPRRIYVGYDPTATSLTVGNLVTIMLLVHAARGGHTPVVVMGGGTGLIGDPSGKSAERTLQTEEQVRANVESQRDIFERVFRNAGLAAPEIVNNLDWLGGLGYIEVLRDVGKHFRVNEMVKKDSVRDRIEREQGISYTEFSYSILQSYDFFHLARDLGVSMQMGGSDQWGNIVAGTDLVGRIGVEGVARCHGLTCPLLTKADGTKFGKTESGAIWLTAPRESDSEAELAHRTSAYQFFQFFLNTQDADLEKYLKTFTLLPEDEVSAVLANHEAEPHLREAQRVVARELTRIVHGSEEAERAESAGKALFSGEIAALDRRTLLDVLGEAPSSERAKSEIGEGIGYVDLLVETGLASSKRQAREFLGNGSVSVNGAKVGVEDTLQTDDLLHGEIAAVRRGKKNWHVVRFW